LGEKFWREFKARTDNPGEKWDERKPRGRDQEKEARGRPNKTKEKKTLLTSSVANPTRLQENVNVTYNHPKRKTMGT